MSLLNQNNKKGKKKDNKKTPPSAGGAGSKFIQKPKSSGFVNKPTTGGSQRGS